MTPILVFVTMMICGVGEIVIRWRNGQESLDV